MRSIKRNHHNRHSEQHTLVQSICSSGTATELTINICTESEHPIYLTELNDLRISKQTSFLDRFHVSFRSKVSEQTCYITTYTERLHSKVYGLQTSSKDFHIHTPRFHKVRATSTQHSSPLFQCCINTLINLQT